MVAASGGRGPGLKKGARGFVRVLAVITAAGSDSGRHVVMRPTGGRAAKHPESLIGVVSAREDVQPQLRLALFQGNQRKRRHDQRHQKSRLIANARCPIFDKSSSLTFKYSSLFIAKIIIIKSNNRKNKLTLQ